MQKYITTINILAILLSPVIAVVIAYQLDVRHERQERRYKVLEKLVAHRYYTTKDEFLEAINAVPIIFKDYKTVKELHRNFYDSIQNKEPAELRDARLIKLILEICNVMGYGKNLEEADIKKIFQKS